MLVTQLHNIVITQHTVYTITQYIVTQYSDSIKVITTMPSHNMSP